MERVGGWRELGGETRLCRPACAWKFSPPVAKQFPWKRSYGHGFRQINTACTRSRAPRQCLPPPVDKGPPVAIVCHPRPLNSPARLARINAALAPNSSKLFQTVPLDANTRNLIFRARIVGSVDNHRRHIKIIKAKDDQWESQDEAQTWSNNSGAFPLRLLDGMTTKCRDKDWSS